MEAMLADRTSCFLAVELRGSDVGAVWARLHGSQAAGRWLPSKRASLAIVAVLEASSLGLS